MRFAYRKEAVAAARHAELSRSGGAGVECFVNKRDHPQLRKNGGFAYTCFGVEGAKWGVSHPSCILSQYSDDTFVDAHIPCVCDWEAANDLVASPIPWSVKRNCVFWRGGLTGGGVGSDNVRIRFMLMTHNHPLFNVGVTSYNSRHKCSPDGVIRVIKPTSLPFSASRSNYVAPSEQRRFKYHVYMDGNVGANRLGTLLSYGSVVFIVESDAPHVEALEHLVPYTHYIPVARDLSDLVTQVEWARQHDDECAVIASNARAFHATFFTRAAMVERVAAQLRRAPEPSYVRFETTLNYLFDVMRCGIYVLMTPNAEGELRVRLFLPFVNMEYQCPFPLRFEHDMETFLKSAADCFGPEAILPPQRWWANGSLICNVMPRHGWGVSMLSSLKQMLAAACVQV